MELATLIEVLAMPQRRLIIAAYDIAAARRLKRALKLCTTYASGGQKSVHECWVTPGERAALCKGLGRICNPATDVWMVADLAERPGVVNLGCGHPAPAPKPVLYLG